MTKGNRERISDWLMAIAGPLLALSLFLPWSHQFSASFAARYAGTAVLADVPRDPSAWQVYSAADILLAVVAAGLVAVALGGGRTRRTALALALGAALAFTIHALAVPPTNGALIFDSTASPPAYVSSHPAAGIGELVALAALALGAAGVALSFAAD